MKESISATSFRSASAQEWETITTQGNAHYVSNAGVSVLTLLRSQADEPSPEGWGVNNYTHSLQCASRAYRANESDEFVICALLHDIGQDLDPLNHDSIAGTLLQPFVSEEHHWMVANHQSFQLHFRTHSNFDQKAVDRHRSHPFFETTYNFCENYDQNCFDPAYQSLPLEHFEPGVKDLFARKIKQRIDSRLVL